MKPRVIALLLGLSVTATWAWSPQVKGGENVVDVKTIDVMASRFTFEPAIITVTQGTTVRLRLHSTDRAHGIAIKAFGVRALIPKMVDAVTVEFVADQAGKFDFTCSEYCGAGHGGMRGRLVVLAREQ